MKDLIVIGAGPGGITSALYAARANLDVAIIEQGLPGGQMNNTDVVENYPGFVSIRGQELSQKMYESIKANNIEEIYGTVTKLDGQDEIKKVYVDDKVYEAKAVIIATGSTHRTLGVPGEDEFNGKGVSYCAICDGAFFRNKDVLIVGGGDAAIEEGLYLAQLANKVTVIHRRDKLRAYKNLQDRAFANDKMEFVWDTVVDEVIGNDMKMTGVKVHNVQTNAQSIIEGDGLFVYVGLQPNTSAFSHLGITDKQGWIQTNDKMETILPGVFAVGDVRQKKLRQITTAVSEGTIAGQQVFYYLEDI